MSPMTPNPNPPTPAPSCVAPSRKRRKEARPAELIEAGLAEFALRGFAGARLEDVAKRAQVAKGTIYRYFESKDALFLAALESRAVPIQGEIDRIIDAFAGPTRDLVGMLVRTVYASFVGSDLKILMRIIIAEGQSFPALIEIYHREMISRGQAILGKIMTRGVSRGEIRPGPITDLPIVILAPALMAAIWRMTFNAHQPIDSEKFMAAHLELLDRGLFT